MANNSNSRARKLEETAAKLGVRGLVTAFGYLWNVGDWSDLSQISKNQTWSAGTCHRFWIFGNVAPHPPHPTYSKYPKAM